MAVQVKFIGDKYANSSSSNPREIKTSQFKTFQPFNTNTSLRINNFIWANTPVKPGKIFLTSQGRRFVLEANQSRVIYILLKPGKDNNKVYLQQSKGFIGDVTTYPFEKAGKNLQAVKTIAEYEVQILIGILSVTSWTAFTIVVGVDALDFTVKNKENFPKWSKIVQACLETRQDLKKYAPTLYDKLVYSTLLIAWEGTKFAGSQKGEIASSVADSAMKDPNVAGRGAGIIMGKIGMNAMNGRLTVLSAIWAILFTLASKSVTAIPSAVKSTIEDIKNSTLKEKTELAMNIITLLRRTNIEITKDEAIAIVSEVMDHPKELINSISKLSKVFKENSDA